MDTDVGCDPMIAYFVADANKHVIEVRLRKVCDHWVGYEIRWKEC